MVDNDMTVPAREMNAQNFLPEEMLARWIRPLIAEMIGAFALTFIGAGAIMTAYTKGFNDAATLILVALAHGLAIGLMIAGAGHISGGHYNPAVTIALWIGGKIGTLKGIGYIAAQLLGAVVGALLLRYIFNATIRDATQLGLPTINYATDNDLLIVGRAHAFVLEMVLTFFLVYVVYGTAVDTRGAHAIAPLAIGLTITMDILVAGPLTGAAMNPSRFFGPALVQGEWKDAWVYFLAPIAGGILAAIVQNFIFIPREDAEPTAQPTEHHS